MGGEILCKLDIEKTYDHVNRSFLSSILEKLSFGRKWISWVRWCISTASFIVLINGTPFGFFWSSRGKKQGGLLSPYLFVIVMEALSHLIDSLPCGGLRGRWM